MPPRIVDQSLSSTLSSTLQAARTLQDMMQDSQPSPDRSQPLPTQLTYHEIFGDTSMEDSE